MIERVPLIVRPTRSDMRRLNRSKRDGIIPRNSARGVYFINPYIGGASGGGAAGYVRSITIDHTQAGSADSTNFPLTVAGTFSYLATVANGGKVQNASGFDVGFFSDSACTTRLKHETVIYTAASGLVEYHVKVPTVSHTVDTVIYMNYGNAAITTDQSDKTNVWTGPGYQFVAHMGDGTTISGADSTSNNQTPTLVNTPTASTGQIGGAGHFAHSSAQAITYADIAAMRATSSGFSVSAWAKIASFGSSQPVLCKGSNGIANYNLEDDSGLNHMYIVIGSGGTFPNANAAASTAAWTLWHGVYDGTTLKLYKNGSIANTNAGPVGSPPSGSGQTFAIGRNGGSGGNEFDGDIDEVRVAIGTALSADWIALEYANQKASSTLLTIGSEVAL